MLKCKLFSQTLTYLGWESRIKYLGGNQIETFTLMYTLTYTKRYTHAHTYKYIHMKTFTLFRKLYKFK